MTTESSPWPRAAIILAAAALVLPAPAYAALHRFTLYPRARVTVSLHARLHRSTCARLMHRAVVNVTARPCTVVVSDPARWAE